MFKVAVASKSEKKDFTDYENEFRQLTIELSMQFANEVYNIWGWIKKEMNLTFDKNITPTRYYNESKQKNYVMSGAKSIWNNSTQQSFSLIREYIPSILEKVPDINCPQPNCKNKFKFYSNKFKVVAVMWEKFWVLKKTLLNIEIETRQKELLELARFTRRKFKLVPNPQECYDSNKYLLPRYRKENFLPKLQEKYNKLLEKNIRSFITIVIEKLPDMLAASYSCVECHSKIVISTD